MKRTSVGLFAVIALLILPEIAAAQSNFETFRLVRTRNIFNPDRRAARTETQVRTEAPRTANNFLSLSGIMVTPEKSLTFLSGSSSEYNKVISVPGDIAGLSIKAITAAEVELQYKDRKFTLLPGQQIAVGDSGPGEVTTSQSAAPATALPLPQTSSGGSKAPAGDRSELLRRMMERCQQQLSK